MRSVTQKALDKSKSRFGQGLEQSQPRSLLNNNNNEKFFLYGHNLCFVCLFVFTPVNFKGKHSSSELVVPVITPFRSG